MKRAAGVILLLLIAAVSLAAAPDPRDAQIDAAVGDAITHMRQDIERHWLAPDLTVGDFLRQTGSGDEFAQALRKADQIGGPRWVDGETCQVKLAIESGRVRDALVKIAQESGRKSPLPADALAAKLADWNSRTFTATGTSISAKRAQMLRPSSYSGAWRMVLDDARQDAIAKARDNAVQRVIESIGSIQVSEGTNVARVLEDKSVRDAMLQWLASRPVTGLEFRNDLSVEITICASGNHVYEAFHEAAAKSDAMPKDPIAQAKLRQMFVQQTAPAVGVARVSGQMDANAMRATRVPRQPPAWINQSLTSDATAKYTQTRLKTARAAENAARDALRQKVDALEMNSTTIGNVAKHDPAVERAVEKAMDRAHAFKIDYLPDGSATVKLSLDPRDLWDELSELP